MKKILSGMTDIYGFPVRFYRVDHTVFSLFPSAKNALVIISFDDTTTLTYTAGQSTVHIFD